MPVAIFWQRRNPHDDVKNIIFRRGEWGVLTSGNNQKISALNAKTRMAGKGNAKNDIDIVERKKHHFEAFDVRQTPHADASDIKTANAEKGIGP